MSRNRITLALGAIVLLGVLVGGAVAVSEFPADEAPDASGPQSNSPSQINVAASGQVQATPDSTVIAVEIEATAENASTARRRVARNVSSVREALLERGLNESQVTTADFDIYRSHERVPGEKREARVVSRARHELRIELDAVEGAGEIIDTAVANGATSIGGIQFTVSPETRRDLKQQALANAMENARGKATTLADGANLTISGVDVVSTGTSGDRGDYGRGVPTAAPGDAGGSTTVEAGPITVSASVSVTYNATSG